MGPGGRAGAAGRQGGQAGRGGSVELAERGGRGGAAHVAECAEFEERLIGGSVTTPTTTPPDDLNHCLNSLLNYRGAGVKVEALPGPMGQSFHRYPYPPDSSKKCSRMNYNNHR
jgi:hypothetical protein